MPHDDGSPDLPRRPIALSELSGWRRILFAAGVCWTLVCLWLSFDNHDDFIVKLTRGVFFGGAPWGIWWILRGFQRPGRVVAWFFGVVAIVGFGVYALYNLEALAVFFLSLPKWVVGGAFGAIAGVLGYGLGRLMKSPRAGTAICFALAVQLVNPVESAVRRKYLGALVVNDLERDLRLYAVLFRLHPEAKRELAEKMQALSNATPDQMRLQAQAASAEIVSRYVQEHIMSAPDYALHELLVYNLEVLRKLSVDRPEICVQYYMGKMSSAEEYWPGFLEKESDTKADLIESAITSPSIAPHAQNFENLYNLLVAGFTAKGYPSEILTKIDQVESLSPQQGCQVGMMFTDVLGSMPAAQSSYVFKNLVYLSKE